MPDPATARERPGAATGESLIVTDDALVLPPHTDPETTYDVLLNGQHVWSLQPRRDAAVTESGLEVSWPKALHPYLAGRAEVLVRHHVTRTVIASAGHVFGNAHDRMVEVLDSQGRELVLDKWGRLIRPLAAEDSDVVDDLITEVSRLLDDLTEHCGLPAYVAYGTLLGAVREGHLIGYDNDLDIAYVSNHHDPVDVARENFVIHRRLVERGWHVRRGSNVRLNVRLKMSDGSRRFVDIFTSYWLGSTFFVANDIGAELTREDVLPLSTAELNGHTVPTPARPEAMLAAAYGEGWRVPDPSFKYETPRWLKRRFGGWFGGLMTHRKHWDSFIKSPDKVPNGPSPFAQWVAETYPSSRPLVDIGTGTGRDAFWFASNQGRLVTGVDYCLGSVSRGRRLARSRHLPVTFEVANLYDTRAVLALGAQFSRSDQPVDVYARFTLHALERAGQDNLLRLASMSLRRGGFLFLEFRTPRDRDRRKVFDDHGRHYVAPRSIVRRIEASGGRIVARMGGVGMAPFRFEDPHVCRIVATWSDGEPDE